MLYTRLLDRIITISHAPKSPRMVDEHSGVTPGHAIQRVFVVVIPKHDPTEHRAISPHGHQSGMLELLGGIAAPNPPIGERLMIPKAATICLPFVVG